MSFCRQSTLRNCRARNREQRRLNLSRRGRMGVAARLRNIAADVAREWTMIRVGTWINCKTGHASRWIIHGDGYRHVSLTVNGRLICVGAERTIRGALARCMWAAGQKARTKRGN